MPFHISTLVNHRWLFFIISAVLLGGAFAGLSQFKFDGSPRVFFSKDDSDYARFEEMEQTYGSDFKIFYMMSAKEGSMLEPDKLRAVQEMTDIAWTLPFVRRVDSLSNFQYTYSADDELFVEDFFGEKVLNDPELFKQRSETALQDIDIVNRLVTADGNHVSIVLSLNITYGETQTPAAIDLLRISEDLVADIHAKYPDIKIAATGNLLSTVYNIEVAQSDMSAIIPMMFGLMFIILGLLLRSVSAVIISLILAILTTVGAMGISSWFGLTFSLLSVNAAIISIIVTVAHCIHIFAQFLRDLKTKSKKDALISSLSVNFVAVSVTSLTTLIGFLSLNTNDLPPAVVLGNASAISVALAWLLSFTILPALVMLLPFNVNSTKEFALDRAMDKLADIVIARKYSVVVFMSLLSVLMIYFSFSNQLNDRLTETLHEPHVFRSDTTEIDKNFGALYINSFHMDSAVDNGIVDPTYLKHMDAYATWLREQPEVTSVRAFSDIIKRLNKSMHNEDPAYYRIPDDRELISQYLLLYEMSLPFGLDLNELVTPDKSATLFTASMPSLDTTTDIEMDKRMWAWQQENFPPEMRVENAALSTIWSYLTIHSLTNSLEGSSIALVLISLIMLVMLRSFRYGTLSLVPNLLPAIFGFGIWYLFDGEIGLGLTCVVIITIGIVVDDTVHLLVKYQRALKQYQGDAEAAVRATLKQVGSALFMTTAVLASGFYVLGTSQIIINSALGNVTMVILLAAYLLDVLLLPALLLIMDRNAKQRFAQSQESKTTNHEMEATATP